MATDKRFDESVSRWLADTAPRHVPERVLDATFERTRKSRQQVGWRALLGRPEMTRFAAALGSATVLLVVAVVALSFYANQQGIVGRPSSTPSPATPSSLGIFEPLAGQIVYQDGEGISAIDPAAHDAANAIRLSNEPGEPLGWSKDGTRLLIKRDVDLFVLHADGTETQVTEGLFGFRGATISPDGSRVAFAAGTATSASDCCSSFALYIVGADGGLPQKLVESQQGILEYPAFSPDGTRIVYDDGAGDHGHSVWLVNADGSDAHQLVSSEIAGAGHVHALAWSPAGDRIALGFEGFIFTFASDGSDFTQLAGGDGTCVSVESCAINLPKTAGSPFWSPDGSQIAYETGCTDGAGFANEDGCLLAIANADGSNVHTISGARPGPWHPGAP
jgi:Tol biopolymer transport system component